MIQEGQIAVFRFPQTDQTLGKLRPALIVRKIPGDYDDWLVCMISTQILHQIPEFDEVVTENDVDFLQSGLKAPSVLRIGRLAVVNGDVLLGSLGSIGIERVNFIKAKLSHWIAGS